MQPDQKKAGLHLIPTNTWVFLQSACLVVISRRLYSDHPEETYEQFTNRYVKFFENVDDTFELKRGLNNCFAYDIVPDVAICEAALRAARRLDDYATGARVFEALKIRIDKESDYHNYLQALKPVKDELGIQTKEELGL
ncbi:Cytochrome c oxidase subunit 6 [Coemansia sp. RSA 1836]|nr:Cytochrome c oxidase subunit 6 [Coemansia sp. RSA 1836]